MRGSAPGPLPFTQRIRRPRGAPSLAAASHLRLLAARDGIIRRPRRPRHPPAPRLGPGGCTDGSVSPAEHEPERRKRSATLRTQCGDNSVDKGGHMSPRSQDTCCGEACERGWTSQEQRVDGHPPTGERAGTTTWTQVLRPLPVPGFPRVLDRSSTGPERSDQQERTLSPGSTGVKTRNGLRTPWVDSPPTSGPDHPWTTREAGRTVGRTTATCRAVHSTPPPRVLSCGRSRRSGRACRPRSGLDEKGGPE